MTRAPTETRRGNTSTHKGTSLGGGEEVGAIGTQRSAQRQGTVKQGKTDRTRITIFPAARRRHRCGRGRARSKAPTLLWGHSSVLPEKPRASQLKHSGGRDHQQRTNEITSNLPIKLPGARGCGKRTQQNRARDEQASQGTQPARRT